VDRPSEPGEISTFLVERYWPDVDLPRLRGALDGLEAAAEALSAAGRPVRHTGSILMPDDEVVFSLIAARDLSAVRELNEQAGLPADRITRAITLSGDKTPIEGTGGQTR